MVVHTKPALPPVGGPAASASPPPSILERGFGPPSAVQRASFVRSMELLFGPSPTDDEAGETRYAAMQRPSRLPPAFEIAHWGDREWVIGAQPWFMADDDPEGPLLGFMVMPVESGGAAWPFPFYPPFDGAVFEAFRGAEQDAGQSRADAYGLDPVTLARLRSLAREAGVSVGSNGLALLHRDHLSRWGRER